MKKIRKALFSTTATVLLLLIFATGIGVATVIENSRGTEVAKALIYNARWMEVLYLLLCVNLIGSMIQHKLFVRRKIPALLFHAAFLLMIVGAGITRYTGFEGTLSLREGETSRAIQSNETALNMAITQAGVTKERRIVTNLFEDKTAHIHESIPVGGKTITVENELFVPNAFESIVPDEQGEPAIALFVLDAESNRMDGVLSKNSQLTFNNLTIAFKDNPSAADLVFVETANGLNLIANAPVAEMGMMRKQQKEYPAAVPIPVVSKTIYSVKNLVVVVKTYLPKARIHVTQAVPGADASGIVREGKNVVVFKVSDGHQTKQVHVFQETHSLTQSVNCTLDGALVQLTYGMIPRLLPFDITLNDFQLERYPGSNSPSSYASLITMTDTQRKVQLPYRIYMNNILKYRGYRFFQSSYDPDEKGTILSVTHDYWGTTITYLGYFVLTIGLIWTLLNKHSRFQTVLRLSRNLQRKREQAFAKNKLTLLLGLLLCSSVVLSQPTEASHFKIAEQLVVQDVQQGRIEPLGTFASDVLRKVSKKARYDNQSPVAVLLGMMSNPSHWQNEPIIKVSNNQLEKELGGIDGYVSFNQLFDFENDSVYKLNDKVEALYHKEQTQRSAYDKELLNVDERLNICYEIFSGSLPALLPQSGEQTALKAYLTSLSAAEKSGNWEPANNALQTLLQVQQKNGGGLLPSTTKIAFENGYNAINPFGWLAKIYALIGFLLLIAQLFSLFKPTRKEQRFIRPAMGLLGTLFILYTASLGVRWYISNHAPWSNGYETLVFVGWATALAGLLFARRSPITLAVTSVLTGIVLFVAGMSWMNPEITPLVPVLKSIWLIIHVAVITSSYGFLAMAALLGLLSLVLMALGKRAQTDRIRDSLVEINYTIELALTIGLVLLTIGCFIGAVWANESWGRYWGWDPKETWALVSIVIYACILHLRLIPKLDHPFFLSTFSVIGFGTILMTFFGVNYYLSGMHSYAQGAPPTIPPVLYGVLAGIILLICLAFRSYKRSIKKA